MLQPGLKDTIAASALPLGGSTSALQQDQLDIWTDSARFDAFSRLRVSQPTNLFSVSSQYGAVTVQMERGNTGTGVIPTHSANTRMVALSCTAGSGTSYMQSFQYIPYQPGKSQEIAITFVFGAPVAGAVMEAMYGDSLNGIIFRQNGTTGLEIVRRSATSGSPVEEVISQSAWNLDGLNSAINPLNPSGVTLDITKAQILFIDLQFLGMGRVRVGFDIGGVIIYCHQFLNANRLDVNYMQSGTLPIQILLTATSTATTKTAYFKCAAVHAEGGFEEDRAYQFSTPDVSLTAANGARTHALSIRPKTTYNGIVNREAMILGPIEQLVTGNSPVYWELCMGVTFSVAPTWADINTANSAFEYGYGGTYSGLTATGLVIASGYVAATNQIKESVGAAVNSKYPCTLDRAGAVRANGTYSLLVTGLGANTAMRAAFNYKEIR